MDNKKIEIELNKYVFEGIENLEIIEYEAHNNILKFNYQIDFNKFKKDLKKYDNEIIEDILKYHEVKCDIYQYNSIIGTDSDLADKWQYRDIHLYNDIKYSYEDIEEIKKGLIKCAEYFAPEVKKIVKSELNKYYYNEDF